MKLFICVLIVFYTGLNLFSQDTTRVYFNKYWGKVKPEDNYEYYRTIVKHGKLRVVKDYYINGQLQMEGSYSNKKCTKKEGSFIYYYKNGNVDRKENFIKDKENGVWLWYFDNGQLTCEELYNKGKRLEAKFWDENGNKTDSSKAEFKPKFNGGKPEIEFRKYVAINLKYPELAQFKGVEGVVKIRFIIEKDGRVSDVKVIESVDPSLDAAALRIVSNSPKWEPGKMHNRYVKVSYTFPINFNFGDF